MRAPIGLIALVLIVIAFVAMATAVVLQARSAHCGPGEHVTRMYTCAPYAGAGAARSAR